MVQVVVRWCIGWQARRFEDRAVATGWRCPISQIIVTRRGQVDFRQGRLFMIDTDKGIAGTSTGKGYA